MQSGSEMQEETSNSTIAATSPQEQSTTSNTTFHPDFSSLDGNVVLASKNCKVMFRTHSYTLKTTSGFFRSMFSLPKSDTEQSEIIYLDDDEITLEHILRMLSGLPLLPINSYDVVESVLHAAETYDMAGPTSIIRLAIMTPPLLRDPLRMYAVSCRYGWEREAKISSSGTLVYNLHDPIHQKALQKLSTSALLNLLALHRCRREGLRQRLNDPPFVSDGMAVCIQCSGIIEYHTWRELKYKIIFELDERPLGDSILEIGLSQWPEAIACWKAACPSPTCGRLLYDKTETLRVIRECIEGLPDTVS